MPDDNRFDIPELDELRGELRKAAAAAVPERRGHKRRMRVLAPIALALGVVVLLGAFVVGRDRGALSVDEAVASVVSASFDTPRKHPSEYLYTRSTSAYFGSRSLEMKKRDYRWLIKMVQRREAWSRPGHTSWTRTQIAPSEYPSEQDRVTAESAESVMLREWRRHNPKRTPPKTFSELYAREDRGGEIVCKLSPQNAWLSRESQGRAIPNVKNSEFPETPEAMYKFLYSMTESSVRKSRREDWVWQMIGDAMSSGHTSLNPRQRAAMVGALALIPNVETFGAVADPTGRPSIGFSHRGLGKVRRIYFDRETGLASYTDTVSSNGRPVQGAGMWRLEKFEYVKEPPPLKPTRGRSMRILLACPYVGPKGHYLRARG